MNKMVFSDELDKSLYMILENDDNNRKLVCDFIKKIPNELYNEIMVGFDKIEEYVNHDLSVFDISDDFCIRGEFIQDLIYKYSFIIDLLEDSLTVSREILIDDKFYIDTEIKLYVKNNYNNIDEFGRQSIGHFKDWANNIDIRYDLIFTIFGKMMMFYNNGVYKKRKRMSNKTIDLDSKYNFSRVRKRN